MSFLAFLEVGSVIAGFLTLWYQLGSRAGMLWTPRALYVAAGFALFGALGFWLPTALDVMLIADVVLILLIWLDATLAPQTSVTREPLPALSVGHTGMVTYRWANASRRRARLRVREIRPEILGGTQPARALTVAARGSLREEIVVSRNVEAIMIPSGERVLVPEGAHATITQSLGGSYTIITDRGLMVRISGKEVEAIGKTPENVPQSEESAAPATKEEADALVAGLRKVIEVFG